MLRALKLACAPLLVAASFGISTGPAEASGDSGCYPRWSLTQDNYSSCGSNGLLSPGNDSRVNLLMLLFDRHGSVGPSHQNGYYPEMRRGEAEPFDWPLFALALDNPTRAVTSLGKLNPDSDADYAGDDDGMSRCQTNSSGAQAFLAALPQGGISPGEIAALTKFRNAMKPVCDEQTKSVGALGMDLDALIKSQNGRMFAFYLIGAAAFYDGNFSSAQGLFAMIAKDGSGWPAETARYMLARTELNAMIENSFDEWGSLKQGAAPSSAAAEAAFRDYLQKHPNGRYAASARGLLRKVYWLGQRRDKLAGEYAAAFAQKSGAGNVSLSDLVQEYDIKLSEDVDLRSVTDPLMLAALDLQKMRKNEDDMGVPYGDPPITRAAIEAQKSKFAGQTALYDYLLAAHAFYVANDPATVLRLIPASAPGSSYLDYSRQALRALALDAKKDPGARDALIALEAGAKLPFQRGTAELALAMHEERNGGIERVFAADSKIDEPDLREILIRYKAGPQLLRSRVADAKAVKRERDVALYTLLYKNLTRGFYGDFLTDVALVPASAKPLAEDDYRTPRYADIAIFKWRGTVSGYSCPAIRTVAQALSTNAKNANALLCLAEFVRLNNLDPDYYGVNFALDEKPEATDLGGTPSLFAGKPFSRLEVYKGVIASPTAAAGDKAYALYRAVNCYAPAGNNACGGVDVPQSQRKAWYNMLKTTYRTSVWAGQLKYYW